MSKAPGAGPRILIVEDDGDLAREIADAMLDYGMQPFVAQAWDAALILAEAEQPDLILLDQKLGATDAVPLLPQLRAITHAPVIFLTGNHAEVDRIVALEIGADDFLLKPISGRELVARIRAHLRRVQDPPSRPPVPTPGSWQFNAAERTLFRPDGEEVPLTAAEFDLLATLIACAGEPVDRNELTQRVLGRPWRAEDRALDNLVLHLRKKFGTGGERSITTIRNRGYVFTSFP